jgi:hypothetical protein
VAAENGRRGLLRLLLADPDRPVDITPAQAERAWSAAAAQADARAPRPRRHQIEATVRALGGEIELSEGGAIVYRFDTGARERQALAQARAGAAPSEALPGRVVFASSEPGSGDLEGS